MRRGGGGGVRRSLPDEWYGEDEGGGGACGEAEEEEEEEDGEKEREGTSKAGWNDYVRGGVSPPGRLSRASFSSASLFPPPPALLGPDRSAMNDVVPIAFLSDAACLGDVPEYSAADTQECLSEDRKPRVAGQGGVELVAQPR